MARYWLGPWEWQAGDMPHWRAPALASPLIDLRSNAQCAGIVTPVGFGVFQTANGVSLGASYENLGTDPLSPWNSQTQRRWRSALLLPSTLTANNLRDAIWETLTIQSDPTGFDRAKPLVPTIQRVYRFGGRSLAFALGAPESAPVIDLLKRTYRQIRQESLDGKMFVNGAPDLEKYRKVLGSWVRKYGIDYRNFQPADVPDEEPLTPATTITDAFTDTNGTALNAHTTGGGWSWNEGADSWDIQSNQAGKDVNTGGGNHCYADTALSSDDHYSQATIATYNEDAGLVVRVAGATENYLARYENGGTQYEIFKRVSGTYTSIANSGGVGSWLNGDVAYLEVNGSDLNYKKNAASVLTVTDTAVSGQLRCGMTCGGTVDAFDDFEAADLAAAANTKRRDLMLLGVGC